MPPPPEVEVDLKPHALEATRNTFEFHCQEGFLRKPVIHVQFTYPRNLGDCCSCVTTDFLYVYVGLVNIFVLQFVVVVILFFTAKELDLANLSTFYQP